MESHMPEMRELRLVLIDAIKMVAAGRMSLDAAAEITGLAQQANNSVVAEVRRGAQQPVSPSWIGALSASPRVAE